MNATYVMLAVAIACEVAGTSFLKASKGFTVLLPSVMTVIFYGVTFYLLSIVVRIMPVGVVYAIWSGLGIVLIALIGWIIFKQPLNIPTLIGLGLIVLGVVMVNLSSHLQH